MENGKKSMGSRRCACSSHPDTLVSDYPAFFESDSEIYFFHLSNMSTSNNSISRKGTVACFAGRGQVGVFSIKTHYKSLPIVPQAGEIGCRSLSKNF
jgi:hypothetical protein